LEKKWKKKWFEEGDVRREYFFALPEVEEEGRKEWFFS